MPHIILTVDLPRALRDLTSDFSSSNDPRLKFAVALLVLAVTFACSRFARSRVRSGLERGGLQVSVAILLARLLWIAVWAVGCASLLYVFGVGLTPLAALIGVVGLAASLALQQVLQNLVAGIYLLAERPFNVGDLILVVGPGGVNHEGTVEDIQMRTTHLRNLNDELILVPNSAVFSGVVTNRTAVGGHMSFVTVTFPRSTDPETVRQRVIPLLHAIPGVLDAPGPQLRMDKVEKEGWTASLLFWVSTHASSATAVWAIADAFPDATVNTGPVTP